MQAAKSLVKTAVRTAAVTGANKLASGAAGEGAAVVVGLEDHFDLKKVLADAGTEAATNLVGVLVGGALSKFFMRSLGEILASRMPPAELLKLAEKLGAGGAIAPELFVRKGWKLLVGVVGDGTTTIRMTAINATVAQLRSGGKLPNAQQFAEMVVVQMIQNGFIQLIFGAITHGRKTAKATGRVDGETAAGSADDAAGASNEHQHAERREGTELHAAQTEAIAKQPSQGVTVGASASAESKQRAADTIDMFAVGNIPKSGPARWKYIENPEVWAPERRALHAQLLADAKKQAQVFADAAAKGQATIYAMRGNTASGKTRAVKGNIPELAGPMSKATDAAVNPDNFKPRLMSEGGLNLTSTQVHSESSMLANRLEQELLSMRTSDDKEQASMMLDKRLATANDVRHYAHLAKQSGRKLNLYDVDAPLETSLAGVLERQPGGADPLPPFKVVGDGFTDVRLDRRAVIKIFQNDPSLGTYELFMTLPSGEKTLVAKVADGQLEIGNPEGYAEITAPPGEMANVLGKKIIDDAQIAKVSASLPGERGKQVTAVLNKYRGRTWRQALDEHSRDTKKEITR